MRLCANKVAGKDEIIEFIAYQNSDIYCNSAFKSLSRLSLICQKVAFLLFPSFGPFIFGYTIDTLFPNPYSTELI